MGLSAPVRDVPRGGEQGGRGEPGHVVGPNQPVVCTTSELTMIPGRIS